MPAFSLLTIYHSIESEYVSQSDCRIRDSMLVGFYYLTLAYLPSSSYLSH